MRHSRVDSSEPRVLVLLSLPGTPVDGDAASQERVDDLLRHVARHELVLEDQRLWRNGKSTQQD